jgi:competence protein ComEC
MNEVILDHITNTIIHIFPDKTAHSVILGITYGIKKYIPPQLYDDLKNAGISHIIVFSGANIVIISSIFEKAMFILPIELKRMLVILAMLLFLTLVPIEPSVIRATLMWIATKTAEIIDRNVSKVYMLILVAIIMLVIEPNMFVNISFQLSFFAVLGIVMFSEKSTEKKSFLENILSDIKTTFSAQVFTAPLIYLYFNSLNPIAFISNILVAPLIRPILVVGLMTPICNIKHIDKIIQVIGTILTEIIIFVTKNTSKYSF